MKIKARELRAEDLVLKFDEEVLSFRSTEELPPLEGIIGQERATRAIDFGIEISSHGYNIFVLGPVGSGKMTAIRRAMEQMARKRPVPDDWCYVNNFEEPDKPKALRLPAGTGSIFRRDMEELVSDLRDSLPRAFESEEYQKKRNILVQSFSDRRAELIGALEKRAKEKGFALQQVGPGVMLMPVVQGKPVPPEKFDSLPREEKERIEKARSSVQEDLAPILKELRQKEKEVREEVHQLETKMAAVAVGPLMRELFDKYNQHHEVVAYLKQVEQDVIENVHDFLKEPEEEKENILAALGVVRRKPTFERYSVNLLVDHRNSVGAPVVVETNPTHQNLLGRIEHRAQFGTFVTSFTMIKPGALHRANGGYLVLEVKDVLMNYFAYDALKRALKNRQIKIEEISEPFRIIATVTLRPEPIPLDVKVILVGNPWLYYLLYNLDEDFRKLFKVQADFGNIMDFSKDGVRKYALFIGERCREEGLNHFAPEAVKKVLEYSSRLVEDRRKLATKFTEITDLVREASFWASRNGHKVVKAEDVKKAIEEKDYRANRIEERVRELLEEGTILVDVDGQSVGQVNGISILWLGNFQFGKPSRITAQTFVGQAGLINIERESKLSGRIHDKGMLILSGYIGGKYAQDRPLSLSASIAFEQTYEEVEGDSAASAEVYALLSSLAGVPIRQDIAVTGSVNQHGEIQPVGGVTRKIEGFFDVCRAKGFTGKQGVIIPAKNVQNLVLRDDVVEAVKEGTFHIYPVETVDEGMEILTGMRAGKRLRDGRYEKGTLNALVQKRLEELAKVWKKFGPPERKVSARRSQGSRKGRRRR